MEIPEAPKDKRTKAYKEWKKKYHSKGVGSTVEKLIKKTGLDTFVDGKDCGCEERKEKLNRAFKPFDCLTEEEYNYLDERFRDLKTIEQYKTGDRYELRMLLQIFNRIYRRRIPMPSCTGCSGKFWRKLINKLYTVYGIYSEDQTT